MKVRVTYVMSFWYSKMTSIVRISSWSPPPWWQLWVPLGRASLWLIFFINLLLDSENVSYVWRRNGWKLRLTAFSRCHVALPVVAGVQSCSTLSCEALNDCKIL